MKHTDLKPGNIVLAWYKHYANPAEVDLYYGVIEQVGREYCKVKLYHDEDASSNFKQPYGTFSDVCTADIQEIVTLPAATPSPLPEAETGVSIDTPTEAEMYSDVWEWDDAQKKKPAPPTPGNERQEGGSEEVQRKLTMALREVMEDLKHMACNYGGYSFEETKKNYYGKIASYANAKAILNSITGGKETIN